MTKLIKFIVVGFMAFWGSIALGDTLEYVPLAPLPGISESGAGVSLETYLSAVFTFGLGIAVVLAVLVLVVAGVEYIGGAASESIKSDAKERIWHAILGLLLAFSSWIILNEINPNLLNVGLKFPASAVAPGGTTPPRPTTPGGGVACENIDGARSRLASGGTVCNNTGSCPSCNTASFESSISKYSALYGVPEKLIKAIIARESSCNPKSVRLEPSIGARSCGLMQVLTTSVSECDKLKEVDYGIKEGVRVLSKALTDSKSLQPLYGNTVNVYSLAGAIHNGGYGQSTKSVDCTPSSGWPTIPKWGCPINPGTAEFNACKIKDYACNIGACQ